MINRAKLQHILEYAKQQRHIGLHCKVPPEDMVEIVEMAMLQGAEPVSQNDELPLDYLQGQKDGLEWAARMAEANHPETGDWLYDDPLELAKAIRKGPDMPEAAGSSPAIPAGYALVPVEPTEEMNKAGWAAMNEHDAINPTYRAMLAAAPNFREIPDSSTNNCRENAETSTNCPHCGRKPLKNRTCSVAGCEGRHVAHGLCQKHYDIEHKNNLSRRQNIRAANKRYRARKSAAPQQEVK